MLQKLLGCGRLRNRVAGDLPTAGEGPGHLSFPPANAVFRFKILHPHVQSHTTFVLFIEVKGIRIMLANRSVSKRPVVPTLLASAYETSEKSALSRILAEAEVLFAERGFDGVSINEVALAAGVCKANVFHHFATKQELYERVLTQACDAFGRSLDALELKEPDLAGRLWRLMEWHNAFLYQRPHGTRLILRELTGSPTVLERSPVFPLIQRNFDRIVGLLNEVADKLREGISPALVAKVVLSLNLFGFQTERLNEKLMVAGSLATRPELQRQWLDLLLHGIEAPN